MPKRSGKRKPLLARFGLASGIVFWHNADMRKRSSKRSRDVNQLAKAVVEEAAAEPVPQGTDAPPSGKNPAAVALGRLGGKKGGLARAAKLSKERRKEIAKKAAATRWRKAK